MNKKNTSKILLGVIMLALLLIVGNRNAMARAITGAIYTTLAGGEPVNTNIYDAKDEVYLNGGPTGEPCTAGSLPEGTYYFQVTDPSGQVLLSTDDVTNREFSVGENGVIVSTSGTHVTAGNVGPCGGIGIQLSPYDNTPNNGDEYKLWITRTEDLGICQDGSFGFCPGHKKTDNFKVRGAGGGSGDPNTICGMKFYDANLNGVRDEIEPGMLEPGIPLWKIWIYGGPNGFIPYETTTDGNGVYSFLNLDNGIYNLCEVIPENEPVWVPTTPTAITGIEVPPDAPDNNFGNVCLGEGGGHTIGFWRNKNGQALIDSDDCDLLAILNLVKENGDPFVPSTTNLSQCRTQIKNWLKNARAVNMAYMLSAQLAAMALNVLEDFVDLYAYVYIGENGCGIPGSVQTDSGHWFITIYDLGFAAISELGTPGHNITTAGSPYRAYQECLKDVLDAANNNENFVQAEPCEVNYSGEEPSCVPTP